MKLLVLITLFTTSLHSFAYESKCTQEVEDLREKLSTLQEYDLGTLSKMNSWSNFLYSWTRPQIGVPMSQTINEYAHQFSYLRRELRESLKKSVLDLARCAE